VETFDGTNWEATITSSSITKESKAHDAEASSVTASDTLSDVVGRLVASKAKLAAATEAN